MKDEPAQLRAVMNRDSTNLDNRPGALEKAGLTAMRGRPAFTLIELLVVIAIIGLLAGLVVGGTRYAGSKMKENRVRAELNALVTAIEAYHAKFNQYPPDNVATKSPFVIVNPVTNSLYYELTGVIVEDSKGGGGTFRSPNRTQKFNSALVQKYFGVDGILNAGTDPKEIKNFLPGLKADQHKVVNPTAAPEAEIEVLVVHVPWPPNGPPPPTPVPGLNPWRYVGPGHATNNPDGFDLWAEYPDRGEVRIIGNWNK